MSDEIVIWSWIFHGLKTRRSQRILCLLNLFAQLRSRTPTHTCTCVSYIINALLVPRHRWGLDGRRVEGGTSAQQQQTQLKSFLGCFPASLGWMRENWGPASSRLKTGTGKHPKLKGVFEGDVSLVWDQGRFPAAFWPDPPDVLTRPSRWRACCLHLSFCHGSGRQTTAGRVKRWLPALRSKTVISSCFPTTCQKWFIGTGVGRDGAGRGGGTPGARAVYWFVLFCPQIRRVSCALLGLDVALDLLAALLCSLERGWLLKCALGGRVLLSLGWMWKYSVLKQRKVACGNRKGYFC